KDIKQGYFNYLMAGEAVNIYRSGLKLTKENLRINKALFDNGKANRTAVIRSENEVVRFESLVNVALQEQENAKAYFNFLLNREADTEIEIDEVHKQIIDAQLDAGSSARREELQQLALSSEINANVDRLSRSHLVPKLNTFLDVGSQGFDFAFDNNSVYYLFGLSLEWNLFASNRNKYKTKQVEADTRAIQSKTTYAENRLKLQLTTSVNNLTAAVSKYSSAEAQLTSSERYYRDLLKQYKEGQILFIELLDGQNQLISSRLNTNIALYDTWSKMAEIERANASFDLNNNTNDTSNQK
ncbi:MAG: TolC family protein, partial [Bacteroidota bacterium]